MIALHPWLPGVAAVGGFLVAGMSLVTLSFLVTTPECWVPPLGSPEHGFPLLSGAGRLVVKDAIMLGAVVDRDGGLGEGSLAEAGPLNIHKSDTALVVIDPQNDVLSEGGVSWPLVGDSVRGERHRREPRAALPRPRRGGGFGVFISPHYLYPTDQAWHFGGAAEMMMLEGKEFHRPGPLILDGLEGSGADWLERYKPFVEDGETVVVGPHKVWGPQTNDLVLQLRKRGMSKVILAGMMANLCVESHLRELLEQGFEVAVVKDATAGPRHPALGDGYLAALVNYGFLANAVLSTRDAVTALG